MENEMKQELKQYLLTSIDNTLNDFIENYSCNKEMGASRIIRYADLEDYVFESYDDDYDFNEKFVGENFSDNNIKDMIKVAINNVSREDLENHNDLQIFVIR